MRSIARIAFVSLAAATTAFAQGPVPPMAGGAQGAPAMRGGVPAARLLLAHTGELGLSDAQVVRLAAIARRSEARRVALRASFDSARQRFAPGQNVDTAARRQFRTRMQADLERARDASQVDQRDAIAVLNADQQAKAWRLVANRGRMARQGAMRTRGMRMRPGRDEMRGMRERRDMREPRPSRVPGDRPMRRRSQDEA